MSKRLHQISHIVDILAVITIVHVVIEIGLASSLVRWPLVLHLLHLLGGRVLLLAVDIVVIEQD